jgi:hypothetical protein
VVVHVAIVAIVEMGGLTARVYVSNEANGLQVEISHLSTEFSNETDWSVRKEKDIFFSFASLESLADQVPPREGMLLLALK